jgi:hypothetical protein
MKQWQQQQQQQQQRRWQQQRRNMAGAAWLEQKRRQQELANQARAAPVQTELGDTSLGVPKLQKGGRASDELRPRGSKLRALLILVVGLGITWAAGLGTGAIIAAFENEVLPFLGLFAVWGIGLLLTLRKTRHTWRGY